VSKMRRGGREIDANEQVQYRALKFRGKSESRISEQQRRQHIKGQSGKAVTKQTKPSLGIPK